MPEDMKVLFPGTVLTLAKIGDVTVFPLGITHISRFNSAIEGLLPRIAVQVDLSSLGTAMKDLLPMIMPILLGECLDLLDECVVGVNLRDPHIPHWILPQVAEAWMEESFIGEGKMDPWIQAVEGTIEKMTGQKIGISEMFSKSLSPQDTN
ncbi:MAG: hypothetical protein COA69_09390 [Robiginitomaculum sp.]|nr:MAG: hypothetical protein COA69_09390 [Robiginitomaculum sp.]